MEQNIIKSGDWGNCLWGIDDAGFLVIGAGFATSLDTVDDVPWDSVRDQIREVSVDGRVVLPAGSSLAGMFKDCINLTRVKLKGLDTTEVVDMSSMFENCESLTNVDLTDFNTINTLNMGRMFSGCRNLASLDLSSFDTSNATNMRNMFTRCSSLGALCLGDTFSTTGDGTTDCGNLLIKDTGKYRMAKVLAVKGGTVTYYENIGKQRKVQRETLSDFHYVIENVQFEKPTEEHKFLGWNEESDGSGKEHLPGEELTSVDNDLVLYAIWGRPPKIGYLEPIPEFAYGQPLPIETPEIIAEDDGSLYGYLEVSPTGEEGSFTPIDRKALIPVAYNGYLVRLCVSNKSGTSVSNAVPIRIHRGGMDLSRVRWAESTNMTYDGTPKEVWLEGLPEGITAVYGNNRAIDAGVYSTSVDLEYDRNNYEIPVRIKNYEWRINKARFDMSAVKWDYKDEFTYDGTEKTVQLLGVPAGLEAVLSDNSAVDADVRTATVSFVYDEDNYEEPEGVMPCVWKINKKVLDTRDLKWSSYDEFVYDGYVKTVRITNLPHDVEVQYSGADETQAGNYLARAILVGNYTSSQPLEHEWEIKKAQHNMSEAAWNYTTPFTYDKGAHTVYLRGLPSGVSARYTNCIGTDAGDYTANATFTCADSHNYVTPADMNLRWSIAKAEVDMSDVHWSYEEPFEYDGTTKAVELLGLPMGVYALIENGTASQTGIYNAHANLKYDERNYTVETPADCQWQITKAKFDMTDVKWDYQQPFNYDGEAKAIKLINLPDGVSAEYENNVKIESGKYVATAKLTPSDQLNYEIPKVNGCAWSIKKATLDKGELRWTDFSGFVYDGIEKKVRIISDVGDNVKIEYSGADAVNAGVHEAVAVFHPTDETNFEAPEDMHYQWRIEKGDFNLGGIAWSYTTAFSYDGNKKTVELVDVPNGVTVRYENNTATDAGDYTAVAFFELQDPDNYKPIDPVELRWTIKKGEFDMSGVAWQPETRFTYDGTEKTVVLNGLSDRIVPIYTENSSIDAGDFLASVEFEYDEHNYEKPTFRSCKWSVEKAVIDISKSSWDYEDAFTYDGMEKTVRVLNLPEGATVEYDNASAVNAGLYYASAEIIPTDTKNYYGTSMPELSWRINKGEYIMTGVFWDYDKPFKYDGFEKRIVLRGLPDGIKVTYDGNYGIDAGIYIANAYFTLEDGFNYNPPKVNACRWIIEKSDVDMSEVCWDYKDEITYDGRMHEITLNGIPKGVRPIYSGNCETNAGLYSARAEFVLFDNENYNTPNTMDCAWEIAKADYDMSDVEWNYDGVKIYNTREQAVFIENLPNGVVASYSNNEATDVGKYIASVTLVIDDELNHNKPIMPDCEWEIAPADIDMSGVKWNYVPGSFVYDGNEKSVALVGIPSGVEVRYTGEKAVGAGTYHATAEFTTKSSNYNTPEYMTCEWTIEKAECDVSKVRWDYTNEFTYNGRTHGIEVTGLPENVTVHYENNKATDAGSYLAVARFSTDADNYHIPEEITCSWTINKANCDISGIRWDYDQKFVYDGREKSVSLAGVPANFSVNYYSNFAVNVGKYSARAEFVPFDANNYNTPLPMTLEWEIVKADYDMSQTRWQNERSFKYDGRNKVVSLEGYPADLRPVYSDNTQSQTGEYFATVTFEYDRSNYNEPVIDGCSWRINKSVFDMSSVFWDYRQSFVYDGREKRVLLANLPTDLNAMYTGNTATDAGDYYAEVEFSFDEHNYEAPSFSGCHWSIERADIPVREEDLVWTYTEPLIYSGSPQSIELATVSGRMDRTFSGGLFSRLFSNKPTAEPEEEPTVRIVGVPDGFEVSYEGNEQTDAGVYYAKALITPIDNDNYKDYTVSEFRWEIHKAEVDLTDVHWDYNHHIVYDGEEKSVELLGLPEQVEVLYSGNIAVGAGRYEAHATIKLLDEVNYSKPHPVKGCIWEIEKAAYDMSEVHWDYEDKVVFDGKEKAVKVVGLPQGVRVESYSGNKATEAGAYTAEAILTYKDPDNFNAPSIEPLRWRVQKRRIDISGIKWTYDESTQLVYDEQVKEVTLLDIPSGVDVIYVNNSKVGAGTYIAKAKLIYDTKNFIADDIPDCVWKIEKATFDTSRVKWTYSKPFVYNGEIRKITLENLPNVIDVRYMDNRASEVGAYTAKAYLTYNRDNYNDPEIDTTIEWAIVRKEDLLQEQEPMLAPEYVEEQ